MRFAAFGRTHWLFDSIQAAVKAGHEIVLIGTSAEAPEYTVKARDFEDLAEEFDIPFFKSVNINDSDYIQMAKDSGADVAISVNWVTLIRQPMLDVFPQGVVNAHAGDLPRYRGNAVPNWAILSGEPEVAVTLHKMIEALDAGPIYLKRKFALSEDTYISDVYKFISDNIPDMYVELLDKMENGSIQGTQQSDNIELSLRCFPRLPQDGEIDWQMDATQIARLVRASAEPFAGAYSFVDTIKITVWRAYASELGYPYVGEPGQIAWRNRDSGEVAVLTGKGVLVLQDLETESGGRTKAAEQIRSLRTRLGNKDTYTKMLKLQEKVLKLEEELQSLKKS